MAGSIQNRWSYAVTYVALLSGKDMLASGTGFFWKEGERTFLITNWHNLSGRDPETQQPRAKSCALPNQVGFLVYKKVAAEGRGLKVDGLEVPLYEGDFERALWLEHPTHHRAVDVAAIDITSAMVGDVHFRTANELEDDAEVEPHVPEDAFIIGYPLGIVTGVPVPVWKRGSIASEPSLDPGDLPRIFVDTATREGMSGSLVLVRHILIGPYPTKGGTASQSVYAIRERILGVYSGRLGDDEVKAQLGIVWKRRLIDETIQGGCPGQIGIT